MKFRAIGFDYGGVIAGIPGPEFERRIIKILGVDLQTFQDVYFEFNHLLNSNALSVDDFWKKISEELGCLDKYNELIAFIHNLPHHEINKKVIALVDALRDSGYKIGLLSNNTLETANRFEETGFADHFDVVAVSAKIGYSKPSPKAFNIFIKQLGIEPGELIFIDDTKKSLEAAGEIGFYPVLFTGYEDLVQILSDIGIKI